MTAASPSATGRAGGPIVIPERAIQSAVMQYLRLQGWYVFRLNAGALPNERGRSVRMLPAGTPDLLAIRDGQCLFVECKRPGQRPTDRQRAMMATLEAFGARCVVATGVEDLERQLARAQTDATD